MRSRRRGWPLPASGAPYVYGPVRLGGFWGYLAGWGFVVGKTASCAAMALTVNTSWPAQALRGGRRRGGGTDRGELRWDTEVPPVAHPVDRRRGVGGLDRSRGRRLWLRRCGPGATRYRCKCTSGGMLQAAGLLFFAFAGYARMPRWGEVATRPARSTRHPAGAGRHPGGVCVLVAVAVIAVGSQRAAARCPEAMRVARG